MSIDLAKLVVSLEAEAARYQSELEKSRKQLKGFESDANKAAEKIGKYAGAAIAGAALAFVALAKNAIDTGDRLNKVSQQTGIATETLSQLQYAAKLADVSSEELSAALAKLSKNAYAAASGGKAQAEAFAAIGVKATTAAGQVKPLEVLLGDVAEAFAQSEDGAAKAAVAQEIFGKAGARLIPFLNQGRAGIEDLRKEADALGLTFGTEAAKAAEQFNDNLSRMSAATQGAVTSIVNELIPALSEFSDAAVEAMKTSELLPQFATAARLAFETIVILGSDVAFVFKQIGTGIAAALAQIHAFKEGGAAAALQVRKDFTAILENNRKELDEFQARILGAHDAALKVNDAMKKWAPTLAAVKTSNLEQQRYALGELTEAYKRGEFGTMNTAAATRAYLQAVQAALPEIKKKQIALKGMGDSADKAAKQLQSLLEQLKLQAATYSLSAKDVELYKLKMAGASEVQIKFADDVLAGVEAFKAQKDALTEGAKLTESLRTPLETYNATLQEQQDLLDRGAISLETYVRAAADVTTKFQDTDAAAKAVTARIKEINDLVAATPTAKLEEQRQTMLNLADAYQRGELGAVGSAEALAKYNETAATALGILPDAVKKNTDVMSEFAKQAAHNLQDTFAEFLFDPFAKGTGSMVDNFLIALRKMAAQAAAAQIFQQLAGAASSSSTPWIQALGQLFGGAHATGGSMPAGKVSSMNESGPELVYSPTTNRVLNARDTAKAWGNSGGGTTVNVTVPGPMNSDDARRTGQQIGAAAARQLAISQARGS